MPKQPRGLVYDLETSYILTYTFSLYPESISHNNIVKDWHIHCASWKWVGEDKVYTAIEKDGCDFNIVDKLSKAINEADYVIAHNGDKFDIKKLGTRVIAHKKRGAKPLPPLPSVDTLKEARRIGAFTSNRLDYLGEYLGVGRKLQNSPNLWRDAFLGNKKALKEMATYNIQDVLLLEEVYLELKAFMKNHPNYNVLMGTDSQCPSCGSGDLTRRGYSVTKTARKPRFQCNACGSWSTGTKSEHIAGVR
jgi:hypothetical protein